MVPYSESVISALIIVAGNTKEVCGIFEVGAFMYCLRLKTDLDTLLLKKKFLYTTSYNKLKHKSQGKLDMKQTVC